MAASEQDSDVALVVGKISAVMEQGDECCGMLSNKSIATWKNTFNAAAKILNISLITVEPLKSGSGADVLAHMQDIVNAFQEAADKPVIVLVDSSGNDAVKDPDQNMKIANAIEKLAHLYPRAIYVQALSEEQGRGPEPVLMYCMKPKVPNTTGRFDPV